jgi:hypothetical protein
MIRQLLAKHKLLSKFIVIKHDAAHEKYVNNISELTFGKEFNFKHFFNSLLSWSIRNPLYTRWEDLYSIDLLPSMVDIRTSVTRKVTVKGMGHYVKEGKNKKYVEPTSQKLLKFTKPWEFDGLTPRESEIFKDNYEFIWKYIDKFFNMENTSYKYIKQHTQDKQGNYTFHKISFKESLQVLEKNYDGFKKAIDAAYLAKDQAKKYAKKIRETFGLKDRKVVDYNKKLRKLSEMRVSDSLNQIVE